MSKRVVIIGGGISGLALAYRLQNLILSAAILVLEKSNRLGGTIQTENQDGFRFEAGPNGFLDNKPSTLNLCSDLGLAAKLLAASESSAKNRFLFVENRLQPLPNSLLTLLRTPLLSLRSKLALLGEPFRRVGAAHRADESIDAFVRRRLGPEFAEVFADALVTGIHAGDPKLLSLPATFPRLAQLEREYGSLLWGMIRRAGSRKRPENSAVSIADRPKRRGSRLWSFTGGMSDLIESLQAQLAQPPLLGVNVRGLERNDDDKTWTVSAEGYDRWPADAVVLACPAYQQAVLLDELDPPLAGRIGGIAYNRVAVIALGFRDKDVPLALDGLGYIAPQRTRRDVLGVQWCSSIFAGRAPSGMVVLRAMSGGWNRPEIVGWTDEDLLRAVRAELRVAMGIQAEPVMHRIIRWDRAIPQYLIGHLDRVAWIEQRMATHPGLFVAGNAYHGVALNDCTEQAEKMAARVKAYLGTV